MVGARELLDARGVAMSSTINGVTVTMGRMEADWRKHAIIVQVHSRVRPGLKTATELDPGQAVNVSQLTQGVGAAAAVGAEHLSLRYGDWVDPSQAVRDAIHAFGEEIRLMAALAKEAPDKVRRLYLQRDRLGDKDREAVERLKYLVDHDKDLTPDESAWVNARIADIHGQQL